MEQEDFYEPIETIHNHISQFFSEDEMTVFQQSTTPEGENQVDICWIRPKNPDLPYSILLTIGVSRYYQKIEKDSKHPRLIELAMLVPKEWDFHESKWDALEMWPIHHLSNIGKIPTRNNIWLGYGHTVVWKTDQSNFPGTNFNSSIIIPSMTLPEIFVNIAINDHEKVYIFSVVPLYPEELKFKMSNGVGDLVEKFNEFKLEEIVDVDRKNTCKNLDKFS